MVRLAAEDFTNGSRLAANHTGDSDSTASITASCLAPCWDGRAIGPEWLDELDLWGEIAASANDMAAILGGTLSAGDASARNPGR